MPGFRLQFRRYRLPFKMPVRTAHGSWTEREGIVVRLDRDGDDAPIAAGFGEAAPIPWFGTETVDEAEEALRRLGDRVNDETLNLLPSRLGCLRHALASARLGAERPLSPTDTSVPEPPNPFLGIAALLPAGRAALAQVPPRADAGFRVFKWKVGVGDPADELTLLDDLCATLPDGGKLRLDANGAWDRRRAERWLERCAERPVEYVEQPCFAPMSEGDAARRRSDDLMMGLAADFPTPIALDESLVADRDVEKWIGAGWPGIYVVKPSLLGDVPRTLASLEKAGADVVFSSALETAVGAHAALRAAFAWRGQPRAAGFGVWPLFSDPRFDGPPAAAYLRFDDIRAMKPEAIWNALS